MIILLFVFELIIVDVFYRSFLYSKKKKKERENNKFRFELKWDNSKKGEERREVFKDLK